MRGALALLFALLGAAAAFAGEPRRAGETEVKAAVIYNLLLFVQWPSEAARAAPLRLCLFDDGELAAALRAREGASVNGRPLQVVRIAPQADEIAPCAAAVLETGNPGLLSRVGLQARQSPLLVIGEGLHAVERGAMIGLVGEGGRIAFDINLGAMRRAGLEPSSKILRLARQVVE